jgi:hypothetical protein
MFLRVGRTLSELHEIITQKTVLFIVTDVRTSSPKRKFSKVLFCFILSRDGVTGFWIGNWNLWHST